MSVKAFWTSFVDGLTGEGLFGDLSIPDFPTQVFRSEHPALDRSMKGWAGSALEKWTRDTYTEDDIDSEDTYVVNLDGLAISQVDIALVQEDIERAVYAAIEGRRVDIVTPEGKHTLVRRAAD